MSWDIALYLGITMWLLGAFFSLEGRGGPSVISAIGFFMMIVAGLVLLH